MKLVIFGATGQVGKELVQQALWRNHDVVAFGRNVYQLNMDDEHLTPFKGTLFDEGEVYTAMQGCDAVLSVIGGAFDGTDQTRSLGMKNIIKQMKKAGLKRIIALGGMGILNADDTTLLIDTPSYPEEFIPVGNEHRKAYEFLQASQLDWTFVCSPDIKKEGPTGLYHTSKDYPPVPNHYRIGAGDLAQFMLNELERNDYLNARVGISN